MSLGDRAGTSRVALGAAAAPLSIGVAATLALGIALTYLPDSRGLEVNLWLLALGGLLMWFCWRMASVSLPPVDRSAFDTVGRREALAATRIDDLLETEAVLLDAEWSRSGMQHRLRPLVRQIARARLIDRYQIDLEIQPDEARRILGEELWALAGPAPKTTEAASPGEPSADASVEVKRRRQPGISREKVRRTIELLEAL